MIACCSGSRRRCELDRQHQPAQQWMHSQRYLSIATCGADGDERRRFEDSLPCGIRRSGWLFSFAQEHGWRSQLEHAVGLLPRPARERQDAGYRFRSSHDALRGPRRRRRRVWWRAATRIDRIIQSADAGAADQYQHPQRCSRWPSILRIEHRLCIHEPLRRPQRFQGLFKSTDGGAGGSQSTRGWIA